MALAIINTVLLNSLVQLCYKRNEKKSGEKKLCFLTSVNIISAQLETDIELKGETRVLDTILCVTGSKI